MANERRLIDLSKLVKPPYAEDDNITGSGMTYDEMDAYNLGIDTMWSRIQHYAPTVDAVEVVRCKDCRYFMTDVLGQQVCNRTFMMFHMESEDFCSYGEKREVE